MGMWWGGGPPLRSRRGVLLETAPLLPPVGSGLGEDDILQQSGATRYDTRIFTTLPPCGFPILARLPMAC